MRAAPGTLELARSGEFAQSGAHPFVLNQSRIQVQKLNQRPHFLSVDSPPAFLDQRPGASVGILQVPSKGLPSRLLEAIHPALSTARPAQYPRQAIGGQLREGGAEHAR